MDHWLFQEDHKLFRENFHRFVRDELTSQVDHWDNAGRYPRRIVARLADLGWTELFASRDSSPDSLIFQAIGLEEMGWGGAGALALSMVIHGSLALSSITKWGERVHKDLYIHQARVGNWIASFIADEGRDEVSLLAQPRGDQGFSLNGQVPFVINGGEADFFCVVARTRRRDRQDCLTLFLVDRGWPGIDVSPLDVLGCRAAQVATVAFRDVYVPLPNVARQITKSELHALRETGQLMATMAMIGVASRSWQDALDYSRQRIQFGRPLAAFQVIQHRLVDMIIDIEKARNLAYWALYRRSHGIPSGNEVARAKAYCNDMTRRVSDSALQILGGHGYLMDYPVQRYWRDARVLSLVLGTTFDMRGQIINDVSHLDTNLG